MNAATRALLVVAALLSTAPVSARRVPAPGGKATMSLPPDLLQPTTDAHLYLALLEPMGPTELARALAHPALPDLPTWRSSVIGSLKSEGGGRAWRTTSKVSARTLSDALERCLAVDVHAESWPADVLRARGVRPTIEVAGDDVVVRLSAPVGPMPELLSGCLLRGRAATTPTGPYMLAAPGVLTWRNVGLDEPPLLGVVELKSAGERADLMGGSPDSISAGMLLAPFPDVVLLLQSSASLRADWFGMRDPNIGPRGFRQSLRADLLVAAYGAGRGTAAQGLLPPGIAPARPLPELRGPDKLVPLSLSMLPPNAPRVSVRQAANDPLVDGVVERLAVLLRTRGEALEPSPADREPLAEGIEILRWRPPTTDAALALLSLAGRRPELATDVAVQKALGDARLLSERSEERLVAALALERALLQSFAVVPLLTAERWFAIDPDLRGVQLRADGVPLMADAYWGNPR